jgi:peroxiredoxin
MGISRLLLLFSLSVTPLLAQVPAEGPTSEKAQKSYKEALDDVHKHRADFALDNFKKADKQDDAAKAQFEKYVKMRPDGDPQRRRVLRYISEPELARARMAPAFAVNTLDGQHISLDDLTGKVVLIDFSATWCGPCREAQPHMQQIAKKFQGQPLVVLSVSLDSDEQKWKDFITKNGMTWVQYRDGGFTGPVANLFGVKAIPQTFTIDADGVLQDQHMGDASIEGKLKKLVARAQELQAPQKALQ